MIYRKVLGIIGLFKLFVVFLPAFLCRLFVRDFWLVCETPDEARDNGYWFFRYLCLNQPSQKCAYVIKKDSPDYEKVKCLGKVVQQGGWRHWFWYVAASKIVCTHLNSAPNFTTGRFLEVVLGLMRKRYFLGHGVTKDNMTVFYYKNTRFKGFFTATYEEQRYVQENFGYPDGAVQLVGLCRYDGLCNKENERETILVMPTWRRWLQGDSISDSNYFRAWNALLNNPSLIELLEKENKRLVFYPHRNMQKFVHEFTSGSARVEVADSKHDVQSLLVQSSLLVTDYSSVFFDVAFMNKPVIFYHFDDDEFRSNHASLGYFDYKNNPFSRFADSEQGLVDLIQASVLNGFAPYADALSTFKYADDCNCLRTYEFIKAISAQAL